MQQDTKTKSIIFAVILVMVSIVVAACAGFDFGDAVRVRTPARIQQTAGLPASLSLNESQDEYEAWYAEVQRTGTRWMANIEKANQVKTMLSQLTLQTLDTVGPTVAGIPALGPALPIIAGIIGLSFKRPGDVKKDVLHREKQDSFNAGLKAAQQNVVYAPPPAPQQVPQVIIPSPPSNVQT